MVHTTPEVKAKIRGARSRKKKLIIIEEMSTKGITVIETLQNEGASIESTGTVDGVRARNLMGYYELRADYMRDHKCKRCEVLLPTGKPWARTCSHCLKKKPNTKHKCCTLCDSRLEKGHNYSAMGSQCRICNTMINKIVDKKV